MAGPIVFDEEHQAASSSVDSALECLDNLFARYITLMKRIFSEKVVMGMTGEALKAYTIQAMNVKKAISVIAECHRQASQCFLSDVDTTDQEV